MVDKAAAVRFESDVVAVLKAAGLNARKPRQDRPVDVGDVWVDDDLVLQAKAWRDLSSALSVGLSGARTQAVHARRPFGAAVIKRPGKGAAEAYVVMTLRDYAAQLNSRPSSGGTTAQATTIRP